MEDNKLTQEMKRHAVIVAIHSKHSDLEISKFFNVTRSFVRKIRRELEVSDGNVEIVAKHRKHKFHSGTVRTPQFVQQVQDVIDEDISKSNKGHIERSFLSAQAVALSTKSSGTSST